MAQGAGELLAPQSTGERVMILRRRKGFSQSALARRMTQVGCKMGNQAISKIETDNRPPTLAQAIALCRVLEVGIESLGLQLADYGDAEFWKDPVNLDLLRRMR